MRTRVFSNKSLKWRLLYQYVIAIFGIATFWGVPGEVYAKPLVVTYPYVNLPGPRKFNRYYLEQLRLALDKAGVDYQLNPYEIPIIPESRSEYNLKKNRYSVHWLHTSPKRERELIPIRVPLFKGLTGWRIFFISKGSQAKFTQITTSAELREMVAGLGHDWPDVKILAENNFRLETSPQKENLFQMQAIGRFDYFPRSVIEIWQEQVTYSHVDIEIEQSLVLRYPTAYYFFVSKHEQELADAINLGMHLAVKDGSFEKNFNKYLGKYIRKANLEKRRVFYLDNPLAEFPTDPDLWYMPDRE